MYRHSLTEMRDLGIREIMDILVLATEFKANLRSHREIASGLLMASLFLEPSTRTRGSFEAAMKRLGGDTITTTDFKSSSMEKGETFDDSIRIWGNYCDLIVLRHEESGAPRAAANISSVPIINAGDGINEHPTQALCDLLTLKEEFGILEGLNIAICGDLRNGRTVHSLAYGLLLLGNSVTFVPGTGLDLNEGTKKYFREHFGTVISELPPSQVGYSDLYEGDYEAKAYTFHKPIPGLDESGHKGKILYTEVKPDALYFTRCQAERGSAFNQAGYPKVNLNNFDTEFFSRAVVMHPLPRLDEVSVSLDDHPRSRYFEQAANGVPIRMALICLMLGLKPWSSAAPQ